MVVGEEDAEEMVAVGSEGRLGETLRNLEHVVDIEEGTDSYFAGQNHNRS